MGKKLNSYRGKLTVTQITDGMNASRRNAVRLLNDAKSMLNANSYPSATALSILSIEESGKVSILRRLSLVTTDTEVLEIWKDYRSHTKKNVLWSFPEMVARGGRKLDDFRPIFDERSDSPNLLDNVKQISIYTDCLGKAHWSEPEQVIDRELAESLVGIAEILVSDKEITVKEIELWVSNLQGVDSSDLSKLKEALLHWYYDMQASGLLSQGYTFKGILDFLGYDFKSTVD
jgi:AbiV family abortive infection protein